MERPAGQKWRYQSVKIDDLLTRNPYTLGYHRESMILGHRRLLFSWVHQALWWFGFQSCWHILELGSKKTAQKDSRPEKQEGEERRKRKTSRREQSVRHCFEECTADTMYRLPKLTRVVHLMNTIKVRSTEAIFMLKAVFKFCWCFYIRLYLSNL